MTYHRLLGSLILATVITALPNAARAAYAWSLASAHGEHDAAWQDPRTVDAYLSHLLAGYRESAERVPGAVGVESQPASQGHVWPSPLLVGHWIPISRASQSLGLVVFSTRGMVRWQGCRAQYRAQPLPDEGASVFSGRLEDGSCIVPDIARTAVSALSVRLEASCDAQLSLYETWADLREDRPAFVGLFRSAYCDLGK